MRRTVTLLSLAGLLPIVILSASFGAATLIRDRSYLAASLQGRASYSAALIGRELASNERATDMMAQSTAFDHGFDTTRFRTFSERLVGVRSAWRRIRVSDVTGRTLLAVPAVPDNGGRGVIDTKSFGWAVAHGLPVVGRVVLGHGGFAYPIRAPVLRDGRVVFVVTAVMPADRLRELLLQEELPQGWSAEVVDGGGNVVGSTNVAQAVGRPAADAQLDVRRRGNAALYSVSRPGGTSSVATWASVPTTDWTVRVKAPSDLFSDLRRKALWLLLGAVVLSLGLFAALALLVLRNVREDRARDAVEVQSLRMEALGRLTGGIAHDFNNLLTPIVGGLDLLRRRLADDPKSLRYLDAAILSADRAKTLVGRLLAYSRRQPLTPRDFDVSELMSGLLDLLDRSTGPGISVEMDVPPNLPLAHADPAQLELAILNLAINARDAMPEGGRIVIRASEGIFDAKTVQAEGPKRCLLVSVVDDGIGMDAATMRDAVEPFFTTKPAERGTGLGLSMVQGFAVQSGGALELSSAPGRGTTATIRLPLADRVAAKESAVEPRALALSGGRPRRLRVLLVDDEADVRATAADALQTAGHRVVEASSMAEALTMMDTETFDALVTDYLMPGGSGGELIRSVRSRHPDVATVLVSGYVSSLDALPDGVATLRKPFTVDELNRAVDAAASGRQGIISTSAVD